MSCAPTLLLNSGNGCSSTRRPSPSKPVRRLRYQDLGCSAQLAAEHDDDVTLRVLIDLRARRSSSPCLDPHLARGQLVVVTRVARPSTAASSVPGLM